ncbi:MAG: class I SAM-dependent methyltransferase [Pirellulales bacterium]
MPEARTRAEVDFIETRLKPDPGAPILDLCCGPGRHAVEFARRGYAVGGIDLNAEYLANARRLADSQKLSVEFTQADMREIARKDHYSACYNWYSSFGYFESEAANVAVLTAIHGALRTGGRAAIDVLNLPWFLKNIVPYDWRPLPDESIVLEDLSYDCDTGRSRYRVTRIPATGEKNDRRDFHPPVFASGIAHDA